MVSFEQFSKEVRKHYDSMLRGFTKERRNSYFEGEEAQSYLKSEYEKNLAEFKKGEITEKEFLGGGASSTGFCLSYMCD